jgi:shikimate kinase
MSAAEPVRLDRPVALCGFMGVGKSSIGRVLAKQLGVPFFDTDAVVVERLGRSIPDLFGAGDEPLFRATEAAVIAELVHGAPAVISLGGGALETAGTIDVVTSGALLVHIDQPWESLRDALKKLRVNRPLLEGRSDEEIHRLYLARRPNYERASITIRTNRDGVRNAARSVIEQIARVAKGSREQDHDQ